MGLHNKIKDLRNQFDENINSHVFLIVTDNLTNALNDIKQLIIHVLNANNMTKKQIEDENYIELTIIRPDNKDINKDSILYLQEQMKTKPILSNKKFYIIENADKMNDIAANKLLKTIEEPQEGIYGFLIVENIDTILPTIKSRCQIETLIYENNKNNFSYEQKDLEFAEKLIRIIEDEELKDLITYKTNDKNVKEFIKTNGKSVANIIKDYYNTACGVEINNLSKEVVTHIKRNNSIKVLISKAKYLNKLLNKTIQNMNSELLIDKIVIDLKDVKNDADSRNKI